MPRKKALLIGINYRNTANELQGCIKDIENVRDFLTQYCDFQPQNITMMSDDTTACLPTRANIQQQLQLLVQDCIEGDLLILHYSGHGSYIVDRSKDETDRRDEVLVPLDFKTAGFLVDDWLFTNVAQRVPKGVTLYMFCDSCHSGTMLDLKYNYKSRCTLKNRRNTPSVYNPADWTDSFTVSLERSRIETQGNVYLLSGSLDPQTAADAFIDNKHQGAFTFCLLESLSQNLQTMSDGTQKRFRNGTIKLRNLLKEINCRLQIYNYSQRTQLSVSAQSNFEALLML